MATRLGVYKCEKSGAPPEADFQVTADQVTARAYCDLHGLWKG